MPHIPFCDRKVTASLKYAEYSMWRTYIHTFRDRKVTAPLKLCMLMPYCVVYKLPWPKGHGPIEASSTPEVFIHTSTFRGRKATALLKPNRRQNTHNAFVAFRGQKATAPLKYVQCGMAEKRRQNLRGRKVTASLKYVKYSMVEKRRQNFRGQKATASLLETRPSKFLGGMRP